MLATFGGSDEEMRFRRLYGFNKRRDFVNYSEHLNTIEGTKELAACYLIR
jgi:hypothetical protein